MPITADDFVRGLRTEVPEASPGVDEHLEDTEGELLTHLLMADLLRFCDEPRAFLASWPEPLRTEWREQHAT